MTPNDRWNARITGLLREAAEVRADRERARAGEDTLLARSETAALLDAIRSHGQPTAGHDTSVPSATRARRSVGEAA
jgi:hypothetical protein